jgi:NADH:ubiquinone oxidoreductase subunit D
MTHAVPSEAEQSELMEISMGPQHPSTHGVFRMDVRLDGERVVPEACLRLPAPEP